MKLQNSTNFPDYFLRRLISWCAREVELPVRWIRTARYRNTYAAFSGHALGHSYRVSVGPALRFPHPAYRRAGVPHCGFADRVEALVGVTAHELYHLWQFKNGTLKGARHNEPLAQQAENEAVKKFAANREALMAEWMNPGRVADTGPKLTIQDRRAAKARADLERWERKLKLAYERRDLTTLPTM